MTSLSVLSPFSEVLTFISITSFLVGSSGHLVCRPLVFLPPLSLPCLLSVWAWWGRHRTLSCPHIPFPNQPWQRCTRKIPGVKDKSRWSGRNCFWSQNKWLWAWNREGTLGKGRRGCGKHFRVHQHHLTPERNIFGWDKKLVTRMLALAEMKALRREYKRIEAWEWAEGSNGLCVGSKRLWEPMAFTDEM